MSDTAPHMLALEKNLALMAGAGAGKTYSLVTMTLHLFAGARQAEPLRPSRLCMLTFTDKAAVEMQQRVDLLVPYGQADSSILTFHAIGDRLLREFGHEIGLPDAPRVIGRAEQVVLLREHMFELGLQRYLPLGDPARFLGSLADLFGRAKEADIATEVTFEDGRKGVISARVKIRDMEVVAPPPAAAVLEAAE